MKDIYIIKKDGRRELLDITKIQKNTYSATFGLAGVNQSELEVDSHIKFIDGMTSSQIQEILIKTAVEKIDIDVPNWTFTAARLSLYDLYHDVGRVLGTIKGHTYGHLKDYIKYGQDERKLIYTLDKGYDLNLLNNAINPDRDYLFNYLGFKTLKDRYLSKSNNGKIFELPQHMFMAVAMFLAQREDDEIKNQKAIEFYNVISQFEVMLATPTLSNARSFRHQLSSCYIGASPDNIEGIFDGFHEMGLLSKFGGGIGWDWNDIRALGGSIDSNMNASSGPIPFLKINNDVAIAVDQLGVRKGAIAVYLEPWHKDIKDFLDLKKNSGEERRRAHELFPALWIPDLFMQRVHDNGQWTLFDPYEVKDLHSKYGIEFETLYKHYETSPNITKEVILAKDLWKKILTSYFESGSPFLCWKDTANKANPNKHTGVIRSSNLCTEIFQNTSPNYYYIKVFAHELNTKSGISELEEFLFIEDELVQLVDIDMEIPAKKITSLNTIRYNKKDYAVYCVEKEKYNGETAVCNLASINLSKINTKEDIERVVPIAVRMLDNVIDLNFYPLRKVKDTNLSTRAIGLGVMGEAQMLAEQKIHFGSAQHLTKLNTIMETVSYNTIRASSDLAVEKGEYYKFSGSNWSYGTMPHDHSPEHVTNILFGDNEPEYLYDWDELREKVKKDGMRNGYLMAIAPTSSISILVGTTQAIEPVYKRKWFEENMSGLIPVVAPNLNPETWEYYTPAYDIDQKDLIRAAAVRQRWIDQGQSTNIFMKLEKASGRYLHEIYTLAWQLGLKSTYYLRGQSSEAEKEKEKEDVVDRSIECQGCQ